MDSLSVLASLLVLLSSYIEKVPFFRRSDFLDISSLVMDENFNEVRIARHLLFLLGTVD